PLGETLGETTAIAEDERRAVGLDEVEDARVDRRPDAEPCLWSGGRTARLLLERQRFTESRQILDGHDDLELEWLSAPRIDDRDVPTLADPAEEPSDRLERALGCGKADSLGRVGRELLQPFE